MPAVESVFMMIDRGLNDALSLALVDWNAARSVLVALVELLDPVELVELLELESESLAAAWAW